MQDQFSACIREHEKYLQKWNTLFNAAGYMKLILVVILGYFIYLAAVRGLAVFYSASAILFVLLAALWIYHGKLEEKINYFKGIISFNQQQLDRLTGNWNNFADRGEEFSDPEHTYGSDLDIVGPKSLFQLLNLTSTWHGRQAFAHDLLYPAYSPGEIKLRQEAMPELSNDLEFLNRIIYYFSLIGVEKSTPKLIAMLQDKQIFIKNKTWKLILSYLPFFTVPFIAALLIFQVKNLYLAGTAVVVLQAVLWTAGISKAAKYLGPLAHLPYQLRSYSTVIDILKNKPFRAEKLQQIQRQLSAADLSAAQAIKALDKISETISIRSNPIVYFILNVFLLWDYRCAFRLEAWKARYAPLAEGWFLALGEFESLLSLSNLKNVCENTCIPAADASNNTVAAKEIGHPLLPNQNRVYNDFNAENDIFIISGSNMSGKTTFLRTVGINLVLAQAGGFVCAAQMTFAPVKIMASMRIMDDLNAGVSTFYAELKRIKTIIQAAQNDPPIVFLIDEIFRGTNSADRLTGAKTVIAKLHELNAIGLITTHDLELCELAGQYPRIKNYSFSEYYENNRIHFDYKMKSGKSNTTNAKYLMEMVGIL